MALLVGPNICMQTLARFKLKLTLTLDKRYLRLIAQIGPREWDCPSLFTETKKSHMLLACSGVHLACWRGSLELQERLNWRRLGFYLES